jgi:hypothetical protein
MGAYYCSECGGTSLVEVKSNMTTRVGFKISDDNQLVADFNDEESSPETIVHWECGDCGLVLPCDTFGEVQAYIEGRL